MKLKFYNHLEREWTQVEVSPVRGLAQAFRREDGADFRLLPNGRVLKGYFGLEIGDRGTIVEGEEG